MAKAKDDDKKPYSESDDFTPNPTDQTGTLMTHGRGGHMDQSAVAPIFREDRKRAAEEIAAGKVTAPGADTGKNAGDLTEAAQERAQEALDSGDLDDTTKSDGEKAAAEEGNDSEDKTEGKTGTKASGTTAKKATSPKRT